MLIICYLLKLTSPIVNLSQPCDVGQKIDPSKSSRIQYTKGKNCFVKRQNSEMYFPLKKLTIYNIETIYVEFDHTAL